MRYKSFLYCFIAISLTLVSCEPQTEPLITPEGEDVARAVPSTVIYECNERLFAKTDAFKAIEAYIPELERMGVNVLWLMPIHPRGADAKSIGSPYCVKDYRDIDPAFGTMADLKNLVNTAHKHDMLVILDWIANHTSWDNRWVSAHPDWYEGPSTGDEQGWADVTFLKYNLQAVRDTMTDCMLYWVREADIDGYRCDYAGGVPLDWWQNTIEAIRTIKPNALMLAETSDARHYEVGFDLLYSWNFLYGIEDLYSGKGRWNSLVSAHQSEYKSTPIDKERMRYITTHDESKEKAPTTIFRDADGELSAFCLTVFMGGVPMIYSSQELGNTASVDFFDYNIMDFTAASTTRDRLVQIMNIYKQQATLRAGTQTLGTLSARVPYIEYVNDDKSLLVICNSANQEQEVKLPMRYENSTVTNCLTDKTEEFGTIIKLKPREYRIYTR